MGMALPPVQVSRQQAQHSGSEHQQHQRAGKLGSWRADGARAEPAPAQKRQHHRQQEGGDAGRLQHQVAAIGAEDACPVVRRARRRSRAGGVQRAVRRGIRHQGEEKEDRGDEQQEADQFVQPPVAARRVSPGEWIHRGVLALPRTPAPARPDAAAACPQARREMLAGKCANRARAEELCQIRRRTNWICPMSLAGYGPQRAASTARYFVCLLASSAPLSDAACRLARLLKGSDSLAQPLPVTHFFGPKQASRSPQ